MAGNKELVIIGDRVLIEPDESEAKTAGGLYLPQGVAQKESVQSGTVVKIGPGYILPHTPESAEPWMSRKNEPQYVPLQVREGDYAIFLRREAMEIEYEGKKYVIIPQNGVLAVTRGNGIPDHVDDVLKE